MNLAIKEKVSSILSSWFHTLLFRFWPFTSLWYPKKHQKFTTKPPLNHHSITTKPPLATPTPRLAQAVDVFEWSNGGEAQGIVPEGAGVQPGAKWHSRYKSCYKQIYLLYIYIYIYLSMYLVYIYIYIHMCMQYLSIYLYIYICRNTYISFKKMALWSCNIPIDPNIYGGWNQGYTHQR